MHSLHKDKRQISSVIWKYRQGYGNLFGGKDPESGLVRGFSTMTMPMHDALRARKFLAKNSITKIDQSPYSPDLAWFFPKLENALKEQRFADLSDIQRNMKR
jgi:hypothetical protein